MTLRQPFRSCVRLRRARSVGTPTVPGATGRPPGFTPTGSWRRSPVICAGWRLGPTTGELPAPFNRLGALVIETFTSAFGHYGIKESTPMCWRNEGVKRDRLTFAPPVQLY